MIKKGITALVAAAALASAAPAIAAVNPFSDVPASHWAYDAVAQLASRGVISGYPDGTYKGAKPATRYELASAVARALAVVDMEKASKQDVDILKRLAVEFKDELDALGVRVESVDARLSVLERDMSGWSIAGELRMDMKFADGSAGVFGEAHELIGKTQFDIDRFRLWLRKRIGTNATFTARLGRSDVDSTAMTFDRYYVTTQIGKAGELSVGKMELDWEDDLGLYIDDDAYYGAVTLNAFRYSHEWSRSRLEILIGRLNDATGLPAGYGYDEFENVVHGTRPEKFEQMLIAGRYDYEFSEKFRAGLLFYGQHSEHEEKTYQNGVELDACLNTYGIYAGYRFTPNVELKGVYYRQELSEYQCDIKQIIENGLDARYKRYANMWRVMLDVRQPALKFTSLWLEYGQMDNNFTRLGLPAPLGDFGADLFASVPFNTGTTKLYGAKATQKWNDRWETFEKYWKFDYDTVGRDDASMWSIGVGYWLNPAVKFELGYESVDYGNSWHEALGTDTKESIVRLRTTVAF